MVSIEEAKRRISENITPLGAVAKLLRNSFGHVLAEDVLSPIDLPGFDQSAMDGFALIRADLNKGTREFDVIGEIQAGKYKPVEVISGQAVRIFTGACIPASTDIVIMQEDTLLKDKKLVIRNYLPDQKNNIRKKGEQIGTGQKALSKGAVINAAGVGYLAAMGIEKIKVIRKPEIALISTGNELKRAGQKLSPGEIYESNSAMIKVALAENGFILGEERRAKDFLDKTEAEIAGALRNSDVLIISGGISVGKYDYVKEALERNDVKEVFYKVDQKPGKPLYFGMKGKKLVFALPGNPASLLTCFFIYVLPALRQLSGFNSTTNHTECKLLHDYTYLGGRPVFLKAFYSEKGVKILDGQASFVLSSFAQSNALVYLDGNKRTLERGSIVTAYITRSS
ncbi:MAG: molybdopterin molybdotransferase MoeA [Vicingaceae bacterium]